MSPHRRPNPPSAALQWERNQTKEGFHYDRIGFHPGSQRLHAGLEADTIGGFNAMIEKQKKAPGEALVSTILFDNVSEVIHDRVQYPRHQAHDG